MVEFIEYNGEKYPIRISYYVLLMAQKESGVALEQLENDFEAQQHILWYALVAGHKMAKVELTLPREEMVWVLDQSYLQFQKAMYGFAKSLVDIQQEAFAETELTGKPKKK
jgi:hypothetical protein